MKRTFIFIAGIMLSVAVFSQTAQDSVYVFLCDQPDAGLYLPAPPDTVSPLFVSDILTWQYGKTLRSTPRGKQASDESLWIPDENIRVCSEAMGIPISPRHTPAIYRFLYKVARGGDFSTKSAKAKYMRRRPFSQMNEHTWAQYDDESFLRTNGSYPSGHTAMGWSTALAATEIAPDKQDTILRRGFQFGENRWIVGAHWRSDVDAGYLCGTASWARAHANPVYYEELEAARKEYAALSGPIQSPSGLPYPDLRRILSEPVDSSSYLYSGDLIATYLAAAERNTPAGQRAIIGADNKTKDLLRYFAPALDIAASKKNTPALFALLDYARDTVKTNVRALKRQCFRKRPYVQLGFHTSIPEEEAGHFQSSSYPSNHSAQGWATALLLTEILPHRQNAILALGYEFGYNRVVAGYHYASDVQAGRLVAACVLARLHSDEQFNRLLQEAKTEYKEMKSAKNTKKKTKSLTR